MTFIVYVHDYSHKTCIRYVLYTVVQLDSIHNFEYVSVSYCYPNH